MELGRASFSGSGFIAATNGYDSWGITAGHVCSPNKIILQGPDGEVFEPDTTAYVRVMILGGIAYEAVVEDIYPSLDLCVLKIKGMRPPAILEMAPRPTERGERVFAMAAPLGTFGADLLPIMEGFDAGQTSDYPPPNPELGGVPIPYDVYTIPTKGGSSGSPIVNVDGELIGVTSGTLVGFENIAFSPPYAGIKTVMEAVKGKAMRHPPAKEKEAE